MASTGQTRPNVAAPLSSIGLEVLLSTVQSADVDSTLHILQKLEDLLSTGSAHRIRGLISKDASEYLLKAFVTAARDSSSNYSILVPLLNMLAKVGLKDRQIGTKAEQLGAVLLILNLLQLNAKHGRRTAACLCVIQVFSSTASTANVIAENQGLDVIYDLLPRYTTKHLHVLKAAINAFTALLCTKANICLAVSKGYISGLLDIYEKWHSKDTPRAAIGICHALLHCFHKVSRITAGSQALVSLGGLHLLYQTTQKSLLDNSLKSLVEPTVQLMRQCLPRTPLPLTKDESAYSFPLPGIPVCREDPASVDNSEESDEEKSNQDTDKDYDDDLETDVNKLRKCPEPDRPKELLPQYSQLCPELSHDFEELDFSSEMEESSSSSSSSSSPSEEDVDGPFCRSCRNKINSAWDDSLEKEASLEEQTTAASLLKLCSFHSHVLSASPSFTTMVRKAKYEVPLGRNGEEQNEVEDEDEHFCHPFMIDMLLERHKTSIPNHEPKLYCSAAAGTRSVPGFNILSFPDFWGHVPPPGHESMAPRKSSIQRQKIFEDIQRFINTKDIINKVVFDLEDDSIPPSSECLMFYSKFECGNLRKAIQVRRHEYDLILNADVNSSQHAQWFYFEVSNMEADVPYRFNLINCEKSNSQFNYGMQPVLYSVKEALEGRPHWLRAGSDICYFRNNFCPARGSKRATFYTLTFTINFTHKEDVCYLAYHYPYTYSTLKAHLKVLQKSVDPAEIFFRQQKLCDTLVGNSCPIVTITACPASTNWKDMNHFRNRPYIVLTGRVHPGESNASWVMKGTLEFLCSSDPVAQSLREAFVFKIVPMLNPDGVINGMNRCDLNCEDLNRQWSEPDPVLSPTIYHTKGLLYYLKSIRRTPLVFCDYHGHSRKKNVFLYGCSVKETLWASGSEVDTASLKEDPGYRTIAKTLDRIAPAFSFNSCNYLVEKSRSATARVVVWREMGVLRSYTMETTYNGFNQGIYNDLQIGTKELKEMGTKFCQSLLSVTKDTKTLYSRALKNYINIGYNLEDHNSHNCFEDDEPPCAEEIEYTKCCLPLKGFDEDLEANMSIASSDEEKESDSEQTEIRRFQDTMGHKWIQA